MAGIRGLDVEELVPERIVVNPDGTAARPTPGPGNPNVRPGGSAEARAFRASGAGAGALRAAPAAGARVAGGVRALMNPTTPIGMALAAGSAVPAMAEAGRDRGAGRAFDDPNAGNVEAGDQRPGQLGAIRADALQDARGQALRAAYADPALAAQTVGEAGAATQQRANELAVVRTPVAPVGQAPAAGTALAASPMAAPNAGPQMEAPAAVTAMGAPGAGPQLDEDYGRVTRVGNTYSGRGVKGDVLTINQGGVDRAARGGSVSNGVGGQGVMDIERRASAINEQNSALRRQLDAYGPGASGGGGQDLSAGYGARVAQMNADTTAAGLRFDAKMAAGTGRRGRGDARAAQLEESARAAESAPAARAEAQAGREAGFGVAALREATARRGQDLGLVEADRRNQGALAVETLRGKSARDIAAVSGDARVAAAEARGVRPVVVDMGEELSADGLTKIKRPSIVVDANTGKPLDIGQTPGQPGGAKPAGGLAADPRAIAIRDDPNLTVAEKKARLQALGY